MKYIVEIEVADTDSNYESICSVCSELAAQLYAEQEPFSMNLKSNSPIFSDESWRLDKTDILNENLNEDEEGIEF